MDELIEYAETLMSFIASNSPNLNPATQRALAELLQNILQVIEEQQSPVEGLAPTAQAQPELSPGGPSSNINSFGYDDRTGKLLVKFQGDYPQENGPVYGYEGVPKQIFELFRQGAVPARTKGQNKWGKWWIGKNPSLGASMFTLIKNGGYSYSKLS